MKEQKNSSEIALSGHMSTLQLLKYVLPTVITVVFASLYGIIDGFVSGLLSTLRTLVFSIGAVLILPIVFYIYYGPDTALLGIWWSVNYSEFFALLITILFFIIKRKKYHY